MDPGCFFNQMKQAYHSIHGLPGRFVTPFPCHGIDLLRLVDSFFDGRHDRLADRLQVRFGTKKPGEFCGHARVNCCRGLCFGFKKKGELQTIEKNLRRFVLILTIHDYIITYVTYVRWQCANSMISIYVLSHFYLHINGWFSWDLANKNSEVPSLRLFKISAVCFVSHIRSMCMVNMNIDLQFPNTSILHVYHEPPKPWKIKVLAT